MKTNAILTMTVGTHCLSLHPPPHCTEPLAIPLLPNEEAMLRGSGALNSAESVPAADERSPLIGADVEPGLTPSIEVIEMTDMRRRAVEA
uniref:Uncharacterized protein n=1 Tax=Steinernema glaseri TaxID=37863 RepID=A0A1I7Y888_9BILA